VNEDRRRLRRALIREEFREYRDAEDADDPHATLDALVDMAYVIVGAALEYSWDFAGAFAAVHDANMAKLGPDGKPIVRDDGKILKPEGWKPADLTPFLTPALPLSRPADAPAVGEYARGFNAAIKAAAGAVEGRRCRDSDALPVTVKAANHALRLAAEAIRALTRPDAAPVRGITAGMPCQMCGQPATMTVLTDYCDAHDPDAAPTAATPEDQR